MSKRVLILKGDRSNHESTAYQLYSGLQQIAPDIAWVLHSYADLLFTVNAPGTDIRVGHDGMSIRDFDVVYLRDFRGYEHERNTCAYFLQFYQRPFVNADVAQFQHLSKLSQMFAFALNDVPVPGSVYGHAAPVVAACAAHELTPRVVAKDIMGVGGSDNHLIHVAEIEQLLTSDSSVRYIVQEYIPNDFDFRITVVGDRVGTVCKRTRMSADDHRNNVKHGATKQFVAPAEVPEAIITDAIQAAQLLHRDIAGVDVLQDRENGRHVVLEANLNFGMEHTGDAVPPEVYPMADYFRRLLG